MIIDGNIKAESNLPKEEDVVEKRIKPTVIRRRKAKAAGEAVPERGGRVEEGIVARPEEKAEEAKTSLSAVKAEKTAEGAEERVVKKAVVKPVVEEKRKSLTIIAQPEELKGGEEEERHEARVAIPPKYAILDKESEKLFKKALRKKKSRAELQYEDIRREGGLKQFAIGYSEHDEPPTDFTGSVSRVFEPGLMQRKRKTQRRSFKKTAITERKAIKRIIRISKGITVSEFSRSMGVKASEIIKKLLDLGITAGMNQPVDAETASVIASEYGFKVVHSVFNEEDVLKSAVETGAVETRPPVVTVMGHVDHGKTSILDIIRGTDIAAGEAGGITQHIGAYSVEHGGKKITFIDTPGHEAFTHMRARGAKVTDIVILVVAADDGVMPQTREAIDHARAANVPIIVAINKIDKPNANINKVKRELSDAGLLTEDWGGETISVNTSAKTKEGIDQLLEMVLLQAEILELKARRSGKAEGIIIESKMDKRRGAVVTAIVGHGTLAVGDVLVAGGTFGKARAMYDDKGNPLDRAYPSEPVQIIGLSDVPEAGERFVVVKDEAMAKTIAENRIKKMRDEQLFKRKRMTLEDLKGRVEDGVVKELNVIVKTDVKGVADAVRDSLPGLSTKDVKVNVLHAGVGGINESDVMLAAASNAVILGFNVVADPSVRDLARRERVEIKKYSIIYEMLDDIKKAVAGLLSPREVETVLGRAEVRETFNVPKVGVIAGCMVTSGKIVRGVRVRLLRDNVIIHDGKIASLKRFKDDAREVEAGKECGIGIEGFGDIKVGDEIETYIIEKIAATWEESKGENPKV